MISRYRKEDHSAEVTRLYPTYSPADDPTHSMFRL
jgi:hypothetical protein